MEFKKRFLELIKKINFTLIGKAILRAYGWGAQLLGGFLLRAAEKLLDRKIGDEIDKIDVAIKDQEIARASEARAKKIKEAKTDEELDEAFRDSLR